MLTLAIASQDDVVSGKFWPNPGLDQRPKSGGSGSDGSGSGGSDCSDDSDDSGGSGSGGFDGSGVNEWICGYFAQTLTQNRIRTEALKKQAAWIPWDDVVPAFGLAAAGSEPVFRDKLTRPPDWWPAPVFL